MMGEDSFGPYRLLRRIAFGGMAEIFLATFDRDAGFQKLVVIKRILPQFSANPEFVRMFIDEAVVAGRLSHPNIAQTYDFGKVGELYFMALEYVDGADLRQVMRAATEQHRPLTFAEVAAIGEGVAQGLHYAHTFTDEQHGPLHIVHRDISPHNIMLSRSGDVKVMDFGIAKAAARATKTATGLLKGKIAYMSPEQAGGLDLDGRCDQFSLGVVLWECVTGRRMYQGGSDLSLLNRVLAGDVPDALEFRPDLSPELGAILRRCLSAKPDDRYRDMREVSTALERFRFSLGARGVVQLDTLVDVLVPKPELSPPKRTLVLEGPVDKSPEKPTKVEGPPLGSGDTVEWPAVGDGTKLEGSATLERPPNRPAAHSLEKPRAAEILVKAEDAVVVARPPFVPMPVKPAAVRSPSGSRSMVVVSVLFTLSVIAGLAIFSFLRARPTPVVAVPVVEVTKSAEALASPPVVAPPAPVTASEGDVIPSNILAPRAEQRVAEDEHEEEDLKKARPASAPKARRVEAVRPVGYLTLRSVGPWVEVFDGKRRLGATPLNRLSIPAGSYRLRLLNRGANVDKLIEVLISENEETVHTVNTSS